MKYKSLQTRKPLSIEIKKTITYLLITLTTIIIGLSAYFILAIGSTSQKGYALKQLQLENNQLRLEGEELESELTKILSYPKVEQTAESKKMIEPENKVYINTTAKKQSKY
jgi:hypothetical protein